jgi:hypothetical protein
MQRREATHLTTGNIISGEGASSMPQPMDALNENPENTSQKIFRGEIEDCMGSAVAPPPYVERSEPS